jgi:hypothetical protein
VCPPSRLYANLLSFRHGRMRLQVLLEFTLPRVRTRGSQHATARMLSLPVCADPAIPERLISYTNPNPARRGLTLWNTTGHGKIPAVLLQNPCLPEDQRHDDRAHV